jgi:methyl-accepting chemotaxis protein
MAILNRHLRKNRSGKQDQLGLERSESANFLTSPQKMIVSTKMDKSAREFDDIAQASIQLAAFGPRLARMAAEMEKEAQNQAVRTTEIAKVMKGFTKDLDNAVRELRESSSQVEDALDTVSRIAKHTRILSINAGIEAVRAGEPGKAFGVVVEEVQRLADQTGETTHTIENRISSMQQSIIQVSIVAGSEKNAVGSKKNTVDAVSRQVHSMAQSADEQLGSAEALHHLGDQINGYTEKLLLALGTFRFEAHRLAESEVAPIVPFLVEVLGDREICETIVERWLREHDSFELAYITDAKGRQFIDNIGRQDGKVTHDTKGYGQDWSRRPWYLDALKHEGISSTDIYRSTATGDFCFTVTAALRNPQGQILGVMASDVNFSRLLQR